ncbi:MAG: HD domain-containing protein [Nanoarchaeota archaeon]|nr:HD domain-containing protein [Nanoarchaeota archaeon]MBU0977870.1 HD domain-containing protein [Nanoarchaeota archaeon]
MKDLEIKLENEVAKYYDKSGGHDIHHVKRVLALAKRIAKKEKNVDLNVLIASVFLHDIAKRMEENGECSDHAIQGVKMSHSILKKIGFPENKIEEVAYCIKVHRKTQKIKPQTIEAKILQDADKIEVFGAIGIARTFADLSARGMLLHDDESRKLTYFEDTKTDSILEYLRSLAFATPNKFNTKTGWRVVKERLKFVNQFVKQFDKEWK